MNGEKMRQKTALIDKKDNFKFTKGNNLKLVCVDKSNYFAQHPSFWTIFRYKLKF